MIDSDKLADRLQEAAVMLRTQGGVTWQRVDDWEDAKPPRLVEPLDDDQEARERAGRSSEDEEDRRGDAAASRYRSELAGLTRRLETDLSRLSRIVSICCPAVPKSLRNRDLLVVQVAAEGWCVSCWRDDQHLTPIAYRPSENPDVKGKPYYKDRCRKCGEWKAEHGQDPPLPILVKRHAGGRITTADVAKALGRAS